MDRDCGLGWRCLRHGAGGVAHAGGGKARPHRPASATSQPENFVLIENPVYEKAPGWAPMGVAKLVGRRGEMRFLEVKPSGAEALPSGKRE